MRRPLVRVLLTLCLVTVAAPAARAETPAPPPADAATIADIRKLLQLTGSAELGHQVIVQLLGSFRQSMPNVPEKFWTDFAKEARPEELVELTVPIYAKYLTHDEIRQLIKFYETPAGRKLVKVLPMITQDSMVAGQQWGRELGERVARKLREQENQPAPSRKKAQ